eukprot:Lithocolla_globosa_v1_NODE_136_length_5835_cov_11.826644.p3 type:complete len:217 gc:universal NODE_136_length_5835_cov_11.826644:4885-4235(-)
MSGKLRPKLLPRELQCIWLIIGYFPENNTAGKYGVKKTVSTAHKCLSETPNSLMIITGDFNRINDDCLTKAGLFKLTNFPTRNDASLDLLFTNIKESYRCRPISGIGSSDHEMIRADPIYTPAAITSPSTRVIRPQSHERTESLRHMLETTNWNTFKSEQQSVGSLNDISMPGYSKVESPFFVGLEKRQSERCHRFLQGGGFTWEFVGDHLQEFVF